MLFPTHFLNKKTMVKSLMTRPNLKFSNQIIWSTYSSASGSFLQHSFNQFGQHWHINDINWPSFLKHHLIKIPHHWLMKPSTSWQSLKNFLNPRNNHATNWSIFDSPSWLSSRILRVQGSRLFWRIKKINYTFSDIQQGKRQLRKLR